MNDPQFSPDKARHFISFRCNFIATDKAALSFGWVRVDPVGLP
jgi:hypothetical protein